MPESSPTTPEIPAEAEALRNIALSGTVEIDWPDLQKTLKTRLAAVIQNYLDKISNPGETDHDVGENQEPNVDKFDLDSSRDEILELIDSFSEAPFTIQRICELLYSPFSYYDRVSAFIRGLEKNLRVISSNNWPNY